jgi:hypothetical protein
MVFRALRRALADRRQRRKDRRVPRRPLADLVEGSPIRVIGIARPLGPVLESPVSRRICVCFGLVIYDWHLDGSVRVINVSQGRAPFSLIDGDAHAVIDPSRAQMSALFDEQMSLRPHRASDETLARLGITGRDWSHTDALEIEEAVIELDERIAVIGAAFREPDLDAPPTGYRDGAPPVRWRIQPTTITDDPRLFK